MNFDLSYLIPVTWLGWVLVSVAVTARHWKQLLAAIICWIVTIDIVGTLSPLLLNALRHSIMPYTIGLSFAIIPYLVFGFIITRFIGRQNDTKTK